ncbi:hypothetical protein MRX96_039681 [Rhipicephalus microplus]
MVVTPSLFFLDAVAGSTSWWNTGVWHAFVHSDGEPATKSRKRTAKTHQIMKMCPPERSHQMCPPGKILRIIEITSDLDFGDNKVF